MDKTEIRLIASLIAVALAGIPFAATAQSQASQSQSPPAAQEQDAPAFTQEQLEQLLAPVALYPDALLAQVLMACTYPLEIVQAARWSAAHPDLKGDAAINAAANESWDPSVKSLVAFPELIASLSKELDHTQDMGDAFLSQKDQVMSTIQSLRRKARDSGNLKTNEQQVVKTEAQTIVIQPASPEVVYVPYYNPTVVYGAWAYPASPPYYYPPPPGYALASGIAFGVGVAATAAIFSNFNWGSNSVNVNVNRFNNLNVNRNYNVNSNVWQHNSAHRGSVQYRNNATRMNYQNNRIAAGTNRDFRGFDNPRHSIGDRPGANSGSIRQQTDMANRNRPQSSQRLGGSSGGNAFGDVGRGGEMRASSERGRLSRESSGPSSRGGSSFGGGNAGGRGHAGGGGRSRR